MSNSLLGEGWNRLIGDQLKEPYFRELCSRIRESKQKTKVYPEDISSALQVFRNTSPNTIKILVIGQDPYTGGEYDGRAFSNYPWTLNISKSLVNILKEVKDDCYDGWDIKQSPSLERWEKQGVFLINRVLTVEENTPNSHKGIGWEKFTETAISRLSEYKPNLVFMLWGSEAQKAISIIKQPENHLILIAGHPSPLNVNRNPTSWFGCKHFSKANDYLLKHKLDFIVW
jgi:uracil-DNA glycosylase